MTDFIKLYRHNLKENTNFNIAIIVSSVFVMSLISIVSLFIFKRKLLNYSVNNANGYSDYKGLLSSAYNLPLKILFLMIFLFIVLSVIRNYYNAYYGEGSSFIMRQLPISRFNHKLSIYFETILLLMVIIILLNIGLHININIQGNIYKNMMAINPNLITNTMDSAEISNIFQDQMPIFSIKVKDLIYEVLLLWPILISFCELQVLLVKIFKKKIIVFYGLLSICILFLASISGVFLPLVLYEKIILGGLNFSNILCAAIILAIIFCKNIYLYKNKYEL